MDLEVRDKGKQATNSTCVCQNDSLFELYFNPFELHFSPCEVYFRVEKEGKLVTFDKTCGYQHDNHYSFA